MSALALFRGPKLRMVHRRDVSQANNTATNSVLLVADQVVIMRAHPSDFPQLYAWLVAEAAALKRLMEAPLEDTTVTDNQRGDQPPVEL